MRLEDYKAIFIAVGLIGILIIASPALSLTLSLPLGEPFSEIYVLGPEQQFSNYPYNITEGHNYSITVGVGNHEGSSTYYLMAVKFTNQTELPTNFTAGVPSSLPSLYEHQFLIQDGQTVLKQLTFSISEASFSENQSSIEKLTINGYAFNANTVPEWDASTKGFRCWLLFELWIYNPTTGLLEFSNRFVNLQLNLKST